MPVSMTPYRVFPDYRHIDPAFFTRHGIRLLLCFFSCRYICLCLKPTLCQILQICFIIEKRTCFKIKRISDHLSVISSC